jgi:hypothetical protein
LGEKKIPPIRAVALKLKQLGYDVIPLYDGKSKPPKKWPELLNTPEEIATWNDPTIAVRTFGTETVVWFDADVQRQDALDGILAGWTERWPDFMARCVRRHSGAVKVTLVGRLVTDKKRMWSSRYGVTEENPGGNRVELFTSNDRRYVAVWGKHSAGREYGYTGPSLEDVAIADLPLFLEEDLNDLLRIANEVMERLGLEKAEDGDASGMGADVLYDLTPEMTAELEDGSTVTLTELADLAAGRFVYVHGRIFDSGSAHFRVKAKVTSAGLTLWDFGTDVEHRWAHLGAQPDVLGPLLKRLKEDVGERETVFSKPPPPYEPPVIAPDAEAPPPPPDGAPFEERWKWLLSTYGYCAVTDTVVELWRPSAECQLKPAAFERRFSVWFEKIVGPRGGVTTLRATDVWGEQECRMHLQGVRMRPDMPYPLYEEGGEPFKNTYKRPVHAGVGDIGPWLRFMVHLLPNEIEREWFCSWLAHKWRNPGVPGVAVVMVACDGNGPVYGAGRGILRDVLARLIGPKYVQPVDFDVLTGKSAQGVYTDWGAYALLVTVNEAKDTADSGRWAEKRAVYERLKELVEPRAIERLFHVKGSPAFRALSFASYLIFSNNRDSLQVPPDDRRFTALANGKRMTGAMAQELTWWMQNPGSIAALARWLDARDLTEFDAFTPLVTATKTAMQELARSEMDDWFAAARERIGRDQLFVSSEVYAIIVGEAGSESRGDEFKRRVQRRIKTDCMSVGNDWRMPRDSSGGRARILVWRDYDGPEVPDIKTAISAVEAGAKARTPKKLDRKGLTVLEGGVGAGTQGGGTQQNDGSGSWDAGQKPKEDNE